MGQSMRRTEEIKTAAYESVMSDTTQAMLKECLYEPTEEHIQYYADTPRIYQEGFAEGVKWSDKHPKSPWVKCEDGLPEVGVHVLTYTPSINKIDWNFIEHYGVWRHYHGYVTMWMPVPSVPK